MCCVFSHNFGGKCEDFYDYSILVMLNCRKDAEINERFLNTSIRTKINLIQSMMTAKRFQVETDEPKLLRF